MWNFTESAARKDIRSALSEMTADSSACREPVAMIVDKTKGHEYSMINRSNMALTQDITDAALVINVFLGDLVDGNDRTKLSVPQTRRCFWLHM